MAPSHGSSSGVAKTPNTEIVSSPADDASPSSSPVVPPQAASTRADAARPATSAVLRRRRAIGCVVDIEDMAFPPSADPGGRLGSTLGPEGHPAQETERHQHPLVTATRALHS